jgi:flagellar hook-associated protein 2
MSDPVGSFSGLASGIQWRDMLDQLGALDKQRELDPLTTRTTQITKQLQAWSSYKDLVTKLGTAVSGLRDGTAFGAFQATVGASPVSGRTLLTASATTAALPGTYNVEVLSLAKAEKLGGDVFADSSTAIGATGSFLVNGRAVNVTASDSLSAIRDKINAVNTGTTASKVTATVVSSGASGARLMLTSDAPGAAGIELTESGSSALQSLGLSDGTQKANVNASGLTQTHRFSSALVSIATALGISMPAPSSITVNGQTISVDLSVDSLSSIVARINALTPNAAAVVTDTTNGSTGSRLTINGSVSAGTPAGQAALQYLGITNGGRSGIAQQVATGNALNDAGGAVATAATLVTALGSNGTSSAGVQVGDTFTISGKRGDGSAVNLTYTVGSGDTAQTLLDRINNTTDGFGAGTRPGSATMVNGKIVVTDGTAGDSQLAFSLVSNNQSGASLSVGLSTTPVAGRQRQVVAGSDAQVRVDGVLMTRGSNSISDAISGVSLNLQQAEVGSTFGVTIARDVNGIISTMQTFASAYNSLRSFVATATAADGALAYSGTLKSSMDQLKAQLLTPQGGLSGTSFVRAAVAGVALSKTGDLTVDTTMLTRSLNSNLSDVQRLFGSGGQATDGQVQFLINSAKTQSGSYAVNITQAATQATIAGTGFTGSYATGATPDTMTITDAYSSKTGNISLANGDSIDTVVTKLNSLFSSQGMSLEATKSGNNLVLSGKSYGSSASFTVAYTGGGTTQLGLAAGTYAGTDVQGTIGGLTATGRGQVLTGATGGATDGLALQYTGATARAAGTLAFTLGVGGGMQRVSDGMTKSGGFIQGVTDSLSTSMGTLANRITDTQARLDRRHAALVIQFSKMEQAMSTLQAQGSRLSSFVSSMSNSSR